MRKKTHKGIIFKKDFLDYTQFNVKDMSKLLNIKQKQLQDFVAGRIEATEEMAQKIADFTNTTKESWL